MCRNRNEVDDVGKGTIILFPYVTLLNFIYIFPRVHIFYMCCKEFYIDEQLDIEYPLNSPASQACRFVVSFCF